jgi:hypothetical protein
MPTSENPVLTFLDSETSGCFADHFVRDGSVVTWLPLKRAASCWTNNNSQVDAYASGLTQMVIDISSYFAP